MGLVECTIDELFRDAVRRFGPKTAMIYGEDVYSWRDLDVLSDIMADRLETKGIRRGDHVGLWGENSVAWIVTFLALQKLGAVSVMLNFNYQRRELVQVMRIGEIYWLCYGNTPAQRKDADLVETAAEKIGEDFKGLIDMREDTLGLQEMLKKSADYAGRPHGRSDCRDTACMLYTTGTTMDPKCVMHSHYSLVNNAILSAERVRMGPDDRICMSQPLFHVFTLAASLLAAIYSGSMLCLLSRFGSEDILSCVQNNKCTILNGVPMNFLTLLSSKAFNRYRTDSLRLSIIGGATVSVTQFEYICQAFPTSHIMKNYGLTEGCNLCNSEFSDSTSAVARTVGRPYPHVEVAIRDPKDGHFLPTGERGEIVARGYSIMKGYFYPKNCEHKVQAIDDEGWLHTGDLGVIDAEGYVTIVGRIKDIIIRGGENISPGEVSREIQRYEPVLDAMVVGAPHPILGEEVIACLMLESPDDYNEQELRSMLSVRLAKYKIPAFFLIYDSFPLKPSGKVDMRALREDVCAKARDLHKCDERYNVIPQSMK